MEQLKSLLPHPHPLEITSGGFTCDGCRSNRSNRRYKCLQGCNWDLCGDCVDKLFTDLYKNIVNPPQISTQDPANPPGVSKHQHPLVLKDGRGWSCDGCRKSGSNAKLRFRCSNGCDFDLCDTCYLGNIDVEVWKQYQESLKQQQQQTQQTQQTQQIQAQPNFSGPMPTSVPQAIENHICTYSVTGNNFQVQRYFECITCRFVNGNAVCESCLNVCHVGHETRESTGSPGGFYCDCGSGSNCKSLWQNRPQTSQQQTPQYPGVSKHRHPLERNTKKSNWGCDGCSKNGRQAKLRFRCSTGCDFDLCETCYLGNIDVNTWIQQNTGTQTPVPQIGIQTPTQTTTQVTQTPEAPGAKLHIHPLEECEKGNYWGCDGCRMNGNNSRKRFRCTWGCDYDLCEKCYLGVDDGKKDVNEIAILVKPGPERFTNLPSRDLIDERQTKFWSNYREPYVNQIVFSNRAIERLFESNILVNEFRPGDEIYGRAIWEKGIRNFAIGYIPGDNGEKIPVYGPTFILSDSYGHYNLFGLDMFIFASVDGEKPIEIGRKVQIQGKDLTEKPYQWCTNVGPTPKNSYSGSVNYEQCLNYEVDPSKTDFYAMNQSIVVNVLLKNFDQSDSWQNGMPVLSKVLSQLPPGKHKITLDLRYRITANRSEIERWERMGWISWRDEDKPNFSFPKVNTEISYPIAQGSFDYIVFPDGPKETYSPFPKRSTGLSDPEADRLESLIFAFMQQAPDWGRRGEKTENILHIALSGNWYELEKDHRCDHGCKRNCHILLSEPTRYGLGFHCTVYRSPLKGWKQELPCRVFDLSIITQTTNIQSIHDIHGVGVGGNYDFDVDMVPDDHWEKVGLKRCPPELRGGLF